MSLPRESRPERGLDGRMNEISGRSAESGNFAHETRAHKGEIDRGNHEQRLERRMQMPVHERHLILVLEVAHGSQTTDGDRRIHTSREVDEETLELADLNARVIADRGT